MFAAVNVKKLVEELEKKPEPTAAENARQREGLLCFIWSSIWVEFSKWAMPNTVSQMAFLILCQSFFIL